MTRDPDSGSAPTRSRDPGGRRRRASGRAGIGLLAVGALVSSVLALPAAAAVPGATTVNNPPATGVDLLVFPARDFISATGYHASDVVRVSVVHPSGTSWTTDDISPQADPTAPVGTAFDGLIEVNHPGGYAGRARRPTSGPATRSGSLDDAVASPTRRRSAT